MKQLILEQTVAFLGHRNIIVDAELEKNCLQEIENLIKHKTITAFLFGSNSNFTSLCLSIVSDLKKKYSFIERIYVRAEYQYINENYKDYLLQFYDDTFFPLSVAGAGRASYIKRNQFMLEHCDIAIFYYNKNQEASAKKSGTKIAYEYARVKNKIIVNMFIK